MDRPFFSLIIPCFNTGDKIRRIMNSLTRQEINRNDLEIICVDDNSTDLSYRQIIQQYDFNVKYAETHTEIHCPGNTRRKGMEYVTGQWLFFCDHDDYFEDHILEKVRQFIQKVTDRTVYVVSTIMNGYDECLHQYEEQYAHKQAWLHGKWYSVDNLIRPFHINFKENLITHEDIYFNSLVLNHLFSLNADWDYYDLQTYRWVNDPNSITRKKTLDRGYLFENFNDYIVSAAEPFLENAIQTKDIIYVNQIMMTVLHAYFYYEIASYTFGSRKYRDIIYDIEDFVYRIIHELPCTRDDIIAYVYSDPAKYNQVQRDCEKLGGLFVCKTSFRDFIYRITNGGL